MRLLHTRELRFQEFFDKAIPKYAILSHRWVDEISYQEFLYLNQHQWAGGHVFLPLIISDDSRRDCSGFLKVMKFREMAATAGYDWAWVDTVCIDKTSSAELSEAINSMFRWYKKSTICYVYLSDVRLAEAWTDGPESFSGSQWFQRGWTLQELIAPSRIVFYDTVWQEIGDKMTLLPQLSDKTRIPPGVLELSGNVYWLSVADRMALAVGRITSREEDRAYSLLGLFDINMPLLYGEGTKAFRRLLQGIMQQINDHSIFVHNGNNALANRVEDFAMHTSQSHLFRARNVVKKFLGGPLNFNDYLKRRELYETRFKDRRVLAIQTDNVIYNSVHMMARFCRLQNPPGLVEIRLVALKYPCAKDASRLTPVFLVVMNGQKRTSDRWIKEGVFLNDTFKSIYDSGSESRQHEIRKFLLKYKTALEETPQVQFWEYEMMYIN